MGSRSISNFTELWFASETLTNSVASLPGHASVAFVYSELNWKLNHRLPSINEKKDSASMCADLCTDRHALAVFVSPNTSCLHFLTKSRPFGGSDHCENRFFIIIKQPAKRDLAKTTTAEAVAILCNTSASGISLISSELLLYLRRNSNPHTNL